MSDDNSRYFQVSILDVIRSLEGSAGNTHTDPRWQAASVLRGIQNTHVSYIYLPKPVKEKK
jgi:hypothetical protein